MADFLDTLFIKTWWRYDAEHATWFDSIYRAFNLFEGCAWIYLAILVLKRFFSHRKSVAEVCYSLAFVAFALTDFREAVAQSAWLVWLKVFILIILFLIRKHVMTVHYPSARVY